MVRASVSELGSKLFIVTSPCTLIFFTVIGRNPAPLQKSLRHPFVPGRILYSPCPYHCNIAGIRDVPIWGFLGGAGFFPFQHASLRYLDYQCYNVGAWGWASLLLQTSNNPVNNWCRISSIHRTIRRAGRPWAVRSVSNFLGPRTPVTHP